MYIKRSIIILIIAVIACFEGYSQEILSNEASYRVEYSYYYKRDSTKTGYLMDTYFLDICKSGHSFFYSRITQYRDSVKQASLSDRNINRKFFSPSCRRKMEMIYYRKSV